MDIVLIVVILACATGFGGYRTNWVMPYNIFSSVLWVLLIIYLLKRV